MNFFDKLTFMLEFLRFHSDFCLHEPPLYSSLNYEEQSGWRASGWEPGKPHLNRSWSEMLMLMLCRAGIGGSCFELVKGGLPAPAASEPTHIHFLQWPHVYTIAHCITTWSTICDSQLCCIILDTWSSTSWRRKPRGWRVKTIILGIHSYTAPISERGDRKYFSAKQWSYLVGRPFSLGKGKIWQIIN